METLLLGYEKAIEVGYVSLSRYSYEGLWPAPCDPTNRQEMYKNCSTRFWRNDMQVPIPRFFRFYANGVFITTRERIWQRSFKFYFSLLARLSGESSALCHGPDTWHSSHFGDCRLSDCKLLSQVGDCHLLEKAWHVMFGEPAEMKIPHEYNSMRLAGLNVQPGTVRYIASSKDPSKCTDGRHTYDFNGRYGKSISG